MICDSTSRYKSRIARAQLSKNLPEGAEIDVLIATSYSCDV